MKDKFIKALLAEIKYAKIRPQIAEEYNNHINELCEELEADFKNKEAALEEAVKRMGNPVEIGKALNNCHKPVIEWTIILLTLAVSAIGFFILFGLNSNDLPYTNAFINTRSGAFAIAAGLIAFAAGIFVDYTKIEKYSFWIYSFSVLFLLYSFVVTEGISRSVTFWIIGSVTVSAFILPFFVVSLSGLIKKYLLQASRKVKMKIRIKNTEKECSIIGSNIIKLFTAILLPLILLMFLPSFTSVVILAIVLLSMVAAAVSDRSFKGSKPFVAAVAIGIIIFPIIVSFASDGFIIQRFFLRLKEFIYNYENRVMGGYQIYIIRQFVSNAKPLGQATVNSGAIVQYLPFLHTDYIFTYIIATFGWIPAAAVVSMFALLIRRMIKISLVIQDYYGKVLSVGICMFFMFQIIMNILMCLGMFPTVSSSLPFVSYGGTAFVGNMLLMGLFLGIYRRKDILAKNSKAEKTNFIHFEIQKNCNRQEMDAKS